MLIALVAAGPLACSSPDSAPQPSAAQPQEPARPAGNPHPQHGGVVFADRDLRFEAAMGEDGEFRVYFTDEAGKPIPASTVADVIVTVSCEDAAPEIVGLQIDEKGESWVGKPQHPIHDTDATVRISYVYRDVPHAADVPFRKLHTPRAEAGQGEGASGGSQHD